MTNFRSLSAIQMQDLIFTVSTECDLMAKVWTSGPDLPPCLPVYYMQAVESEKKFARELHERMRREFPEVGAMFQ